MFTPLRTEDPTQVSGYPLRARLGAGGMGRVYLSATPGGRPVALKVIRPDYADDPEFRRRFAQEVQAAQRVNGVYTAQLLDADPNGETPWLAGAYIAGPSLAEAVRDHGPLPVPVVRGLVAAVALSLQAIHAAGVVHRDLKPHNIILAADGPRVIDFGVSRAFEGTYITVSGSPIGTPAFMSPEQADGVPAGPPSDIFSLGAVAYFAATGRSAFGEGQMLTVLRRVSDGAFDLAGCPPELLPLVEGCLAKDPARRPTEADVIVACGGVPQFTPAWLPPPIMAGIDARTRQLTALLSAPAPAPQPAAPLGVTTVSAAPQPATPRKRGRLVLIGAAVLLILGIAAGAAITAALGDGASPGGGGNAQSSTRGATTKAAANPPAIPTGSPSATGSAAPSARTPQWTGTVTVSREGVNLDLVPPKVGDFSTTYANDLVLGLLNTNDMTVSTDDPLLAKWTGSSPPTEQQCADLVSTQGVTKVQLVAKEAFCMKTDQGRVAFLVAQNLAPSFGDGFRATTTVWPLNGS